MGYIGTFPKNTTAVMGQNVGRINNMDNRIAELEKASSSLGSELSTTSPNGSTTVFNFNHAIGIIHWNGQQIFAIGNQATYTQSGANQITFINSNVPVTNDDIINTF